MPGIIFILLLNLCQLRITFWVLPLCCSRRGMRLQLKLCQLDHCRKLAYTICLRLKNQCKHTHIPIAPAVLSDALWHPNATCICPPKDHRSTDILKSPCRRHTPILSWDVPTAFLRGVSKPELVWAIEVCSFKMELSVNVQSNFILLLLRNTDREREALFEWWCGLKHLRNFFHLLRCIPVPKSSPFSIDFFWAGNRRTFLDLIILAEVKETRSRTDVIQPSLISNVCNDVYSLKNWKLRALEVFNEL